MRFFLLLSVLFVYMTGFSESLSGTFRSKLHQVSGNLTLDTNSNEIIINGFSYEGKGTDVYIILSSGEDFKNSKIISKKLKTAYINEDLKLRVNNLANLINRGYTTVSVYTKKYKSSFGDATLSE